MDLHIFCPACRHALRKSTNESMLKLRPNKYFHKRKGEQFMADKIFENNQVSIIGEIVSDFSIVTKSMARDSIWYRCR